MDVRRAEGECGSAVSGLGLISHHPRRVCIPLLSSGLSTSYRFVYLIVLSFLLLLPCIISVCPLFFTLVFSSLFWLSAHNVTNHFCVPLFCHLYSAIMLYIQFLSRFCPQSTSTTHNTSNLPALFSRCDHHGLVFSFFLSPLLSTIVLIVSHVLHVRLEDTRQSFFIFYNQSDKIYTLCEIVFMFMD